jgi:thiol-disulfide isomerase/thioredoxin
LRAPGISNPVLFRIKSISIAIFILISVLTPVTHGQEASRKASDFSLPVVGSSGLTGEKISLSLYLGRVILLEFMEPTCVRCQRMAPILDEVYQKYEQQEVVFLSVAGPWNGATANDATDFIRAFHSQWTFVYDQSGTTFKAFNVTVTPTFFLINEESDIVVAYSGEVPASKLTADIARLLQPVRSTTEEFYIDLAAIISVALIVCFLAFSLLRKGTIKMTRQVSEGKTRICKAPGDVNPDNKCVPSGVHLA